MPDPRMIPLESPEPVGEVTAAELLELRARRDVKADIDRRIAESEAESMRLRRMSTLLANEVAGYGRAILDRIGLDVRGNAYRIDEETGTVHLVARSGAPIDTLERG